MSAFEAGFYGALGVLSAYGALIALGLMLFFVTAWMYHR